MEAGSSCPLALQPLQSKSLLNFIVLLPAEVFKQAECIVKQSAKVQCYVNSTSMTPKRWRIAICLDSVLVMTAQQLLNNLAVNAASLQQIDLLVRGLHLPLTVGDICQCCLSQLAAMVCH